MAAELGGFFTLDGPLDAGPAAGQMRAANLAGFHALVQRYGGDSRRILEKHGLDPIAFADPDNFIDCTGAVSALEDCRAIFGDSLFGLHLAELQGPDVFGAAAALGRAAPSVGEGLRSIIDYLPVTHSKEGELELSATGATAELRWRGHGDFALMEQANYQALLLNLKLLRMLAGAAFQPQHVDLMLDVRSTDRAALEDAVGCRVHTRRPSNGVAFSVGLLERPVATSNRLLFNLLGGYLKQVKTAATSSTLERVESYIRGALPSGACTVARCAKQLGLSVRSLQLRLSEAGVKFSDLLERQRIEAAKQRLRDGETPIHELAAQLGYSEQASFGRAFKRWTGVTPGAYRGVAAPGAGAPH